MFSVGRDRNLLSERNGESDDAIHESIVSSDIRINPHKSYLTFARVTRKCNYGAT